MNKLALILVATFSVVSAKAIDLQPMVELSNLVKANAPANWTAGDNAKYNMTIGSFLKGTMEMSVTSFDGTELAINQKLDLQIMQQDCNMVIDVTTGETKSLECNGQAQDTSGGDVEVIDSRQEQVTVPAGTFESTYIKALEKSQNQEMEQWINPYDVAVVGLIKMKSQTQMGAMEAVLTSFNKQ